MILQAASVMRKILRLAQCCALMQLRISALPSPGPSCILEIGIGRVRARKVSPDPVHKPLSHTFVRKPVSTRVPEINHNRLQAKATQQCPDLARADPLGRVA